MTEPLVRNNQTGDVRNRWQEVRGKLALPCHVDRRHPSAEPVVRIFRPARPVTTSARWANRPWRLVFERRSPPFIEHLMGYTGGNDPLAQVELHFPTRDAAVSFAERQKLNYTVVECPRENRCEFRPYASRMVRDRYVTM